ncbi:MAG: methylamine utilization protein [Pseudohongiella sp.]|nr:methylamine utilization protein [Pseudohongiella sp.]
MHLKTTAFAAPRIIVLAFLFAPSLSAGELEVVFKDDSGQPIANAVVEVISPEVSLPLGLALTGMMDQVDKEFVGPVLLVVQNSLVQFPNSDDIHHHVYSYSDTKRFELPLYTGNTAEPVLFDKAGVATIGCNIHDWMVGYIYISQTHLAALSDSDGRAVLTELDAGEYKFRIWHSRIKNRDQATEYTVIVPESGTLQMALELELNPDRRIRRAPVSGRTNY